MVSLLSLKIGGPEGFTQSRHPVSCTAKGSCTGGTPTEWVFRFLCVLRNVGFYGGRSANPATNLLIINNSTAGGRPQTQLGTRYGWPLAHKEQLHPLTGFVVNPVRCPYHASSSPENLVEEMI